MEPLRFRPFTFYNRIKYNVRMLLFAYGSNMDAAQLSKRLGRLAQHRFIGNVQGYKFGYFGHSQNWQGHGSADMMKTSDEGSGVWGVVYEVTEKDLDILDEFEHVSSGRYKRIEVEVEDKAGDSSRAVTYVLSRSGQDVLPNKPGDDYRKKCVEAAAKAGLPEEYIDATLRHS